MMLKMSQLVDQVKQWPIAWEMVRFGGDFRILPGDRNIESPEYGRPVRVLPGIA